MGNQPIPGRGPRGNRNYRGPSNKIRKNDRIRASEVRVIGPNGNQIGVMSTRDALKLAKDAGLDLIEISPNAQPPVCRILDYGKYMYEQSKKTKDQKSSSSKQKEVKFRINIDQHDYVTKLKRAEGFLSKGNKLKITLMLRGREMEHADIGFEIVRRAIKDLEGVGHADAEPRQSGRNIGLTISPHPAHKRKLKFNASVDDIDEDEDEEE